MANYISKEYLDKFISTDTRFTALFSESRSARSQGKPAYGKSVFLSHKHHETTILQQAIALLKGLGVQVYVDWQDDGMPSTTSGNTAKRIKDKITQMDKFILLATEAAIASKWCNWELGFGDAKKYPNNIAVMPILNTPTSSWSGQEYLQIYPIITSEYLYTKGDYYVEFQGNKIKLSDWLRR